MLSNKIHAPRPREDMLVRPRLLDALATEAAPYVLVTGPAGSGKTVLVRQWLDRLDQPAAWFTIDPRDNDPARFWTYFTGAVSIACPTFGWSLEGPVTADSLEALTVSLDEVAPLVLVLDDLHFLVEAPVLEQLGQLVDALPVQVRLVLVSRALPELRLARHRALGAMVEVHGHDLLFTEEETAAVLRRQGQDPLTAAVFDSTRGWPVAVAIAASLPDPVPGAAHGRPTARSRRQIADYLTEEVLRAQPAAVQEFLLDTSILDEISVKVANAVRGTQDAASHLHYLERHDVFLTQLDGGAKETWRHHALVRDHLRQTLERTAPGRWARLHRQAAQLYAKHDLEAAIAFALTAPDPDLAADLIERGMDEPGGLVGRSPNSQVLRWLEALPDAIFSERKALRSLALSSAAIAVRSDLVDRWLAARPAGTVVAIEELFAQAWRADLAGDMPAVREVCLQALTLCQPDSVWWKAMHGGLAGAEYMLGHWEAAVESFVAMQGPLLRPGPYVVASHQELLRAFPVVIRARQGARDQAAAGLEQLHRWLTEVAGVGYETNGLTDWAEAMVAFHAGDIAKAIRWDTLPDESTFADQPLPPMVFRLDLATVRRAAGDDAQAAQLLADVRRRLAPFADPGLFPQWVAKEEAALGIAAVTPHVAAATQQWRGTAPAPEPLSQREREVLRLLRSEFTLPEIASHLYVSYNTAKTHTRMIYRKLGVSSRSAAVARAKVAGYL